MNAASQIPSGVGPTGMRPANIVTLGGRAGHALSSSAVPISKVNCKMGNARLHSSATGRLLIATTVYTVVLQTQ